MVDSIEIEVIGFLLILVVIIVGILLIIRIGLIRLLNYEKICIGKWSRGELIRKYKWRQFTSIFVVLLFSIYYVILPLLDFAKTVVGLYDTVSLVLPGLLITFVFAWYGYKSSKMMKGEIENRAN